MRQKKTKSTALHLLDSFWSPRRVKLSTWGKTMKDENGDLLTAPQVAKHCSADLKTIHNWVNAGQIRSFRTPGRHLRFHPEDVVQFLEEFGYPVPLGLLKYTRRVVMVIDPDVKTLKALRRDLEPRHEVKSFDCPVRALLAMEREQPDLIVSEVDLPGVDGYHLVERLTTGLDEPNQSGRPVVVYCNDGDENICIKAGASALVHKPNIRSLRRQVSRLLDKRSES